jgi:hypothetical protein
MDKKNIQNTGAEIHEVGLGDLIAELSPDEVRTLAAMGEVNDTRDQVVADLRVSDIAEKSPWASRSDHQWTREAA